MNKIAEIKTSMAIVYCDSVKELIMKALDNSNKKRMKQAVCAEDAINKIFDEDAFLAKHSNNDVDKNKIRSHILNIKKSILKTDEAKEYDSRFVF